MSALFTIGLDINHKEMEVYLQVPFRVSHCVLHAQIMKKKWWSHIFKVHFFLPQKKYKLTNCDWLLHRLYSIYLFIMIIFLFVLVSLLNKGRFHSHICFKGPIYITVEIWVYFPSRQVLTPKASVFDKLGMRNQKRKTFLVPWQLNW